MKDSTIDYLVKRLNTLSLKNYSVISKSGGDSNLYCLMHGEEDGCAEISDWLSAYEMIDLLSDFICHQQNRCQPQKTDWGFVLLILFLIAVTATFFYI